jgi:hypothetical protein
MQIHIISETAKTRQIVVHEKTLDKNRRGQQKITSRTLHLKKKGKAWLDHAGNVVMGSAEKVA